MALKTRRRSARILPLIAARKTKGAGVIGQFCHSAVRSSAASATPGSNPVIGRCHEIPRIAADVAPHHRLWI